MSFSKPRKPMKRTRWRKGVKTTKQALTREADELIQRVAIARDKGLCQRCGKLASEGHHIIHRRYRALRWQPDNVVSLCRDCHSMDGTIRRPELTDFCIRWVGGVDAMDALRKRAYADAPEDPGDAISRLKKELDNG